ncbi:MAG: hypothetical protein IT463_03905 [Planctomycetes bacterium]|nr:hypothetical protein [Planctomycetota bacterium]
MRYLLPLCLLLAACSTQGRPVDETESEPDFTATDARPEPEAPAERFLKEARREDQLGRPDRARVAYQNAFRRDRWLPAANDEYQDLMLRSDLFDVLWQEYLDLWQQHSLRGDAFWYHLRPLLLRNPGLGVEDAAEPALPDEAARLASRARQEAFEDRAAALATVEEALVQCDHRELHVMRIEMWPAGDAKALQQLYAARADEQPESGDAVALYARALALTSRLEAVLVLRDALVLELPGFWLRHELAEQCLALGESSRYFRVRSMPTEDMRRDACGWLRAAEALFDACAKTQGAAGLEAAAGLARTRQSLKQCGADE